MRIKFGKYLLVLEINNSGSTGPGKSDGPAAGTGNSADTDKALPDTFDSAADTGTAAGTCNQGAGTSKSLEHAEKTLCGADSTSAANSKSPASLDISDINTMEFVSHELKGVLGSTILCVYSIRDGLLGMLNFKQRASIETTIRNLRRLESTIKDFLDISRLEDGKLKIRKTNINVNEDIINEVEDAFLTEIYENRVVFENKISKDLIIVSDRTLLMTIFNNLVSNAIKYGVKEGSIVISAEKEGDNLIRFVVYNDGIPITPEDKSKLFKKFSRLEKEHDKKIKGTGLGLFIIKDIIKNLGGSIWVETNDNGNEFIFEIERV